MGIEALGQRDEALALQSISEISAARYRDMAAQRMGFQTAADMLMLPAERRLAALKLAREQAAEVKDWLAMGKLDAEIRKMEMEMKGGLAKDQMDRTWKRLSGGTDSLPEDVARRMGIDGTDYPSFVKWWREQAGMHLDLGEYIARLEAGKEVKSRDYYRGYEFYDDIVGSIDEMELFGMPEEEKEKIIYERMNMAIMSRFPGAVFGKNEEGYIGWFDEDGRLIRAWRQ